MKNKKNLKIGALIILALVLGFLLGTNNVSLFPNLRAQEGDVELESEMGRATSSRHGYGMYLSFEYEIVTNSYGKFVVVKQTGGGNNNNNLTVAGL